MPVEGGRASVRALWRELPSEHRRWILINAVIVTAFINAVINAGLAYASSAGEHRVPLWSVPLVEKPSTVVDTVGTYFFLPLITCLLVTTVVWREVRTGRLSRLDQSPAVRALMARLPRTRLRRGVPRGVLCTLALGPVSALVLAAIDFSDLTRGEFALYE